MPVAFSHNCGFLQQGRNALKDNMLAAGLAQPANTEAHHLLAFAPNDPPPPGTPLGLQFLKAGLDPNDPAYGICLDTTFHRKISQVMPETKNWGPGGVWNSQWKQFFANNSSAKAVDIIAFLNKLEDVIQNQSGPIDSMNWPFPNP